MSSSVIRNQKAKLAADYNELLKELCSPKLKSIGCYDLGETIGKGSYGKVKLGVHKLTCRLVAIKQINKKHAPLMAREIHHHRQLNHPNIVSLYEILSTETSIFIVSEHCPHGDLFDALTKKKRFNDSVCQIWFKQLIDAVDYCHQLGIIHRDLKLENILLDEHDNIKLCDFGFARQTDKNQLLKTFCGSLAYSAPEVIQRQTYFGPATDIWSLGVILYTLLAGELPFDDDCESVLQKKIISLDYTIPSYFSTDVSSLITCILKLNPNERLKSHQILSHPWLSHNQNNSLTSSNRITTASSQSQQDENKITHHLLSAGIDMSVIQEMKTNHVGMLGTLWSMLVHKKHKDKKVMQEESWTTCFKSWLFSKPPLLLVPIKTAPFGQDPAYKELNNSSTCSSTADDDDDDHSSNHSSPATSLDDDDEDMNKNKYIEPYHMTAFHRVSPMPSRADILIPRSRYKIVDRQNNLRNRLENKMIIEEEEEEE